MALNSTSSKIIGLLVTLSLTPLLRASPNDSFSAFEPKTFPLKLPAINSVEIDRNGMKATAASDAPGNCDHFLLTKRDVLRYLKRARQVSRQDYLHQLDWAPCYAAGKVVFANGVSGTWGIQEYLAGTILLSSGKEFFLYCPDCRFEGPTLPPASGAR